MKLKTRKTILNRIERPGIDPIIIPSNLPKPFSIIAALLAVFGIALFYIYPNLKPFIVVPVLTYMILYSLLLIKRHRT